MLRTSRIAALLGLSACNFQVPSSSYLVETRLLAVLVEVVELGELNPDRVGAPSEVPIAEAMPFDVLAFEAFVVDRNGKRIAREQLDSLWFQCGIADCGRGDVPLTAGMFDDDCGQLEWYTMDSICRLGRGDGVFEFELPPLDLLLVQARVAQYYGVIAWEGRSAESCWVARRSGVGSLDNCGFIQRPVKIGPSWWLLAYADSLGLISPIPINEIPAGVYLQAANRVPEPSFVVSVDGQLRGSWPEQTSFEVAPGDRISIDSQYDEIAQLLQTYFTASLVDPYTNDWLYLPAAERLGERPFSSNAIVWLEYEPTPERPYPPTWEFVVDEYADAGRSRILFLYFDDRFGEGVATLEFEVRR